MTDIDLVYRTANQCYQSAAELSADLQDFQRSMELYQNRCRLVSYFSTYEIFC